MSSPEVKIAIVGATGQTGQIIVAELLASTIPKYFITALTRSSSINKPANLALAEKGIKIVVANLTGPQEDLVKELTGIDIVISTIYGGNLMDEIPLITASKTAGVKRYLPCFFATVAPPKGALMLREMKEVLLNHLKTTHQPYTIIDVGWWYQVTLPRLPSGRIDYAVMETAAGIAGKGDVPFALTDLRDVGRYVVRIIGDERTLNRMVFAWNEVWTQEGLYGVMERLSGESLVRVYVPPSEILSKITTLSSTNPSPDSAEFIELAQYQYWYSCCGRGDNTPENAKFLGYVSTKELYPEMEFINLETYAKEMIEGKGKRVYEHLKDLSIAGSKVGE